MELGTKPDWVITRSKDSGSNSSWSLECLASGQYLDIKLST